MRDSLIWNELGTVYSKLGCLDEAMDAFHKAINDDPTFGLPYSNLGWSYFNQGKFAEAISLYEKSLELLKNDKEKAFTWDRLGEAYYQIGNFAKSAEAYQKANELGSNHKKSVVGSSSVTAPRQTNSLSGLVSPPITEADAGTEEQQFQESVSETESPEQIDEILPSVEEVIEPEPALTESEAGEMDVEGEGLKPNGNGNGRYPISSQFDSERSFLQTPWLPVYATFSPLLGMDARNPTIRPSALLEVEGEQDAPVDETQEDSIDPVDETSMNETEDTVPGIFPENLKEPVTPEVPADDDLKKIELEIERLEQTTNASPNSVRAWGQLGGMYKEVNRYEDAVHAYEQASSIEPGNPEFHYRLGQVYTALKDHDNARLAYERTIELNPGDVLAHCALAGSYRHLGMDEQADEHVALARPSMQDENEYNRACFEAISGNVDEAIELLSVAIENQQTTLDWIAVDPDLDFIRDDERIQALLGQDESDDLSAQEPD